ncbi:GumC family protein [Kaistia adipata]|uniref:GumC family protein n=1 Tax=Kaistia adipata TaxID=166954 RepID=UPI000414DD98|nr:GumC family protein [Kaistia adipata]
MDDVSRDIGRATEQAGPWPQALDALGAALRRWLWAIVIAGIAFGALGMAAKTLLPKRYSATAQFLIDPRGNPVFPGDLSSPQYDANSQIGIVESQMRVITSERVLSRVLDDTSLMADLAEVSETAEAPLEPMPQRPEVDATGGKARALAALQRSLSVQRAERSYVVDVTATARTPALAARLANAVVEAYVAEDAANRAETAKRLTDELTSRLASLRQRLSDAQQRAEQYRLAQGLVSTGDRLVVEQKLAEAISELGMAQLKLDQATSRAAQLDSSSHDVGMLGSNEDTRSLLVLIERQNTAQEELAALTMRLGARHPALAEARERVEAINRRIDVELGRIKAAAAAEMERARTTQQALARSVETLSAAVAKTQQAKIEMRTLEQEVESNRALLESFQTRALQLGEFGRIDPGAVRIVSVAQPPPESRGLKGMLVWGVFSGLLGVILATVLVTFRAMLTLGVALARGGLAQPG